MTAPAAPTDLETYLFDLQGFVVLRQALSPAEVAELDTCLDTIPRLAPGEWHGYVHAHTYGTRDGLNYQQVYEAGEPFERLIDHPAWIEKIKHFVGGAGTFDYHHGPLFIDENFANFRGPGEAIGLHSGATPGIMRNQFRYHNGRFMCGQVNILAALTEVGPGDGGTMLIPGSHKANFPHPALAAHRMKPEGATVEGAAGAIEVQLKAGDALIFVDGISHGSARRQNAGERRVVVYRYGPSWGNFRFGYQPSPELLARLTPERRKIVQPLQLLKRIPNRKS
ncbi:MAG: phytanoyl-CoA dioxygenase family protein [Candidatus Handelsmanbacteria bacterium]|nr:phytanoyl-CoA dioxygenase family protein [Candidatus Handelsmanbacteria bacterium]